MLLAFVMSSVVVSATPAEAAPAHPWPPAMTLEEAAKGRLKGVGTEPFWGMEINSPTITMTEPGDEDVKATEFRIEYTAQAGPDVHVWTSGPLSVTVSSGECSDGMSDTVFPYKVEATLMGEETRNLKGCAYRPWGEDVVAAMPVIDACLKAAGGQPPVVYAAATAPDAGFALLAGSDEDPLQGCVVAAGKAVIASYPPDAAQPAGTNAEIFVRGPGKNPGGECYEAPEVLDAEGKLLGWWLDPLGC